MSFDSQIYLLFDPIEKLIKIGVTRNLRARCISLSRQAGRRLRLIYSRRIGRDVFRAEQALHKQFKDRCRQGEWFAIAEQEAIAALETVAMQPQFND